jgi:hypothetical protein
MNSKDEHELAKQHDPNDELEEVEDMEQPPRVNENDHETRDHSSVSQDTNPGTPSSLHVWMSRIVVISVHIVFMAIAVIMEATFVYTWSEESDGVVWISATDQSVVQHLKMMLWPWLLVLFPMDLLARRYWFGRTDTFYVKQISKSSWLTLCMAELLGIITAMLIIAIFYAIFYYAGNEALAVDVILFLVAVVIGIVWRLFLLQRSEQFVAWWAFGYLLMALIWFFTYFSYSDDIFDGYWFNPDPYNKTDLEDNDRWRMM